VILIGGMEGRAPWLRPCLKPQKKFPDRKNQASYAGFAQSWR